MLSEQLKTATLPAHQAIESVEIFRRLMQNDFSKAEYLHLLQLWKQFICPLETQLLQIEGIKSLFPDMELRLKGPLILKDLEGLEYCAHSIQEFKNLPSCQNMAEALSILYVLEGSTLGAQFIIKQLQKHDFINANNTTFYKGYGLQTGKMWKSFKQTIDSWGETSKIDQAAVVSSALLCFNLLAQGMSEA